MSESQGTHIPPCPTDGQMRQLLGEARSTADTLDSLGHGKSWSVPSLIRRLADALAKVARRESYAEERSLSESRRNGQ